MKQIHISKSLFIVILGSTLLLGVISAFIFLRSHPADFSATALPPENGTSSQELSPELMVEMIGQREMKDIESLLIPYSGKADFLADVQACQIFQDIHTTPLPEGFWLSFQCAKSTEDVLHPYFGYIQTADPKRVYWSEVPVGKVVSEKIQDGEKWLVVENKSDIPWSITDRWENFSGESLQVSSPDSSAEIAKGDVTVFITSEADEALYFGNIDHGYYIELK